MAVYSTNTAQQDWIVVNRVTPGHLVVLKLFRTNATFCKSPEAPAGLYRDANLGEEKVH